MQFSLEFYCFLYIFWYNRKCVYCKEAKSEKYTLSEDDIYEIIGLYARDCWKVDKRWRI